MDRSISTTSAGQLGRELTAPAAPSAAWPTTCDVVGAVEQRGQAGPHQAVVIDEEEVGSRARHLQPPAGVPRPGRADATAGSAPASAATSVSSRRPKWPSAAARAATAAGSKPGPSSVTPARRRRCPSPDRRTSTVRAPAWRRRCAGTPGRSGTPARCRSAPAAARRVLGRGPRWTAMLRAARRRREVGERGDQPGAGQARRVDVDQQRAQPADAAADGAGRGRELVGQVRRRRRAAACRPRRPTVKEVAARSCTTPSWSVPAIRRRSSSEASRARCSSASRWRWARAEPVAAAATGSAA